MMIPAALLTLPAVQALAAPPVPADPRLAVIDYQPDRVHLLQVALGYQVMIELAPDETIENVAIGNAAAWQAVPNRRGNLLFVKPIQMAGQTNLTIVTDVRRYLFDLEALSYPGAIAPYHVRFRYAAPVRPASGERPDGEGTIFTYRIEGDRDVRPAEIFDDGRSTYIAWATDAAIPAVFAVGEDRQERVVNGTMRGDYLVVDQIAAAFVFRIDGQRAVARREQASR
jgi:type IV secretion system protein VirB9